MTWACTTPTEDLLIEWKNSINKKLLPNLRKNWKNNKKYWNICLLPIRDCGPNTTKPDDRSKEYERSVQPSSHLSLSLSEAKLKQQRIIHEIRKKKAWYQIEKDMKTKFIKIENRSLDLDTEKGASR